MSGQPPYIKFSKSFKSSGALRLLNKGKVGQMYVWFLMSQDEHGLVELDEDDIVTATGVSRASIAGLIVELEAVSLIEAVPSADKSKQSYRLLRDFSRFGPGAPTGDDKKIFSGPISSRRSLDPDPIKIQNQQLQLPLPAPEKISEPPLLNSPFALYEAEQFGKLTPLVAEKIGDWIDMLDETSVVEAMRQAAMREKRSWPYVEGILKDWARKKQVLDDPQDAGEPGDEAVGVVVRGPARPDPILIIIDGQERDARTCWQEAYGELRLQMAKDAFETWLRPAQLIDVTQHDQDIVFRIEAHSKYAQEWLSQRLNTVVTRTLSGIVGQPVKMIYEVKAA